MKKTDSRLDWIKAVILGHAIADALGVPAEFKSRSSLLKNPVTDYIGFGSHRVPAGTWSDDTSMSLAALDSLSRGIDYRDMMQRFCSWVRKAEYTATGEVFDIGIATSQALRRFMGGTEPLKCGGYGERDNGNGSLMRIHPAVLYCKYVLGEVASEVSLSMIHDISALTHAHLRSQIGCGIYGILLSSLLDTHDKKAIARGLKTAEQFYGSQEAYREELKHYSRIFDPQFRQTPVDEISSSGYVVSTLEAAVYCILNTDSYEEAVLMAVNLGDDTDTVGAVTGGLAGALYGLEEIPEHWIRDLLCVEDLLQLCEQFEKSLPPEKKPDPRKKITHAIEIQSEILREGDMIFCCHGSMDPAQDDRRREKNFFLSEPVSGIFMGYFLEKYYDPDLEENRKAAESQGEHNCFSWDGRRNFYGAKAVSQMIAAMMDLMLSLKAGCPEYGAKEAAEYLRRGYLQYHPEADPEQVPYAEFFYPLPEVIDFYHRMVEKLLNFMQDDQDIRMEAAASVSCGQEEEKTENEDLLKLKILFKGDSSGRYALPFLGCLRNSLVFVPVQAILSERDQQRVLSSILQNGQIREGQEWSNMDQIRMKPDILQTEDGTLIFPVFSNEEELRKGYEDSVSAIPMTFPECVAMAHRTEGVSGLFLDAFSDVYIGLPFEIADMAAALPPLEESTEI